MNKYSVTFLDDEPQIVRAFIRKTKGLFSFKSIDLPKDVDELVASIIRARVHAVVVDYHLNSARSEIGYDGADIVRELSKIAPLLPTFLLTAYVETAEDSAIDVNKVYEKEEYLNNPDVFNRRIRKQIQTYVAEMAGAEQELNKLLKIQAKGKMTLENEERLIELDNLLERSLHPTKKIPNSLKTTSNAEKLEHLIDNTTSLIKEIKALG